MSCYRNLLKRLNHLASLLIEDKQNPETSWTTNDLFSGDLNLIKDAVILGADINKLYVPDDRNPSYKQTLLCYYSEMDDISIAKWLLENGANVNKTDVDKVSPLSLAIENARSIDMAELLLKHGANPNKPDIDGNTPLYMAVTLRRPDMVELLLKHGANPNDNLSLFTAMSDERFDIAELLLKNGTNPNTQRDSNGNTPLLLECIKKNKQGVELLLKYGADPNKASAYELPLVVACKNSNLEIVRLLLNYGADVNKPDPYRTTPLMEACINKRLRIIKLLLKYGAKVDSVTSRELEKLGLL